MTVIRFLEDMQSGMPICWLYRGESSARVGVVTQVKAEQGAVEVQEGDQVSTIYFADMTSVHEAGSVYLVNEIRRLRAMVANRDGILREISGALARKTSL